MNYSPLKSFEETKYMIRCLVTDDESVKYWSIEDVLYDIV